MFTLYNIRTSTFYKTEIFAKKKNITKITSAAIPSDCLMILKLYISRKIGAFNFTLSVSNDNDGSIYSTECVWSGTENDFDIYEIILPELKEGLYLVTGKFKTALSDGVFIFPDGTSLLPVTVYKNDYETPDWLKGGIMYQIFVDRFSKSSKHNVKLKEGANLNPDWENGIPEFTEKPGQPLANNVFFGGSLYGIIEKLDYLSSLGVTTLYLNPIFDSPSNHKYDTSDYFKIDSMFGGEEAFKELISEIKKRNMHLIIDGVFNHTGADSVYFDIKNKYGNGAYHSKKSPYYKWYNFSKYPSEYNCWWGVKILPAVNKNSDTFREFITGDNGVIANYMKMGIDGWRLDVADELSDNFLTSLRNQAKKLNKDAFIVGEVWEDASVKIAYGARRHYFQGQELDSVMNYPLRTAIINYVTDGIAENIAKTINSLYLHYPKCVSDVQMNLLGTHDTERILNILSGDGSVSMTNKELSSHSIPDELRKKGKDLLKLASFLLFTLPGVPCIYYGDEIGMEGGRDPFNRMPFAYKSADNEILSWYRELAAMRKSITDLKKGDLSVVYAKNGIFIFKRGKTVFAVNKGENIHITSKLPFKEYFSKTMAKKYSDGFYRFELDNGDVAVFN